MDTKPLVRARSMVNAQVFVPVRHITNYKDYVYMTVRNFTNHGQTMRSDPTVIAL